MLTTEVINQLIGVGESYQASYKLQEILMDKQRREQLFRSFLDQESDLTFDWFTDYFQEEHSDRKGKKQDFTPDGIIKIANGILGPTDSNADICAGTGGLTIKRYANNPDAKFYCEEFSDRAMPFLLFNLMIRNVNATVCHGDSLTRHFKHVYQLTKGENFSELTETDGVMTGKSQTVIMNPPYSLKWEPQPEMLKEDRFKGYDVLAPKGKADYAFLLQGVSRLADNGTMAIILPHGVLFRGAAEEKIRHRLIELNLLDAVIGLPEKAFLATDIPTVILVIKKNRSNSDVLFIDAAEEYKKQKPYNVIKDENVIHILDVYRERKAVARFSEIASLSDIQENEYNLNIPRYVDTFIPEVLPSMSEIMDSLKKSDAEITKNGQDLGVMMSDLEGNTPKADAEIKSLTKYWCDRYGINLDMQKTKKVRGEQLSLL